MGFLRLSSFYVDRPRASMSLHTSGSAMRVDNVPQNRRRIRADCIGLERHQLLQLFLAFLVPERDRHSRTT
jgi:hypothetical protein